MGQQRQLTAQQMMFVDYYIAGNNATKAATLAGYSEASARQHGCRLLKKVNIRQELERRRNQAVESLEISPEMVLRRLLAEMDNDGPGASATSRIKAAELLGKNMGMFTESHKVENVGPAPVIQFVPATRSRIDDDDGDC